LYNSRGVIELNLKKIFKDEKMPTALVAAGVILALLKQIAGRAAKWLPFLPSTGFALTMLHAAKH